MYRCIGIHMCMYMFVCLFYRDQIEENCEKAMEPKWSECCHETFQSPYFKGTPCNKGRVWAVQDCRGPCSERKNGPKYKGFREEPRFDVEKEIFLEFFERSVLPSIKGCISDFRPKKGPNINDHIHLIFPNDPLAGRPISMPSKNRVSVGSLGSEICTQKVWVLWFEILRWLVGTVGDWLEHYLFSFFDGLLMGRAASESLGKIRWMWSFMFGPFLGLKSLIQPP